MILIRRILILSVLCLSFGFGVDFDIDKALLKATKEGKHLMIFLHKDNCPFCEKMIFVLDEPKVAQKIKEKFVLLDINIDDDESVKFKDFNGTNREFAKYIGVSFYPVTLFVDEKGEIFHHILGFRDTKKSLLHLDYIGSGSFKQMGFEEYKSDKI